MYKLWCIFLMQLFNFTPLNLCAGALALTLGGARSWSATGLPATTSSVERSFSALKRIKTYNRNRTEEKRLSSLAIIAIEKERQQKLRQIKEDF